MIGAAYVLVIALSVDGVPGQVTIRATTTGTIADCGKMRKVADRMISGVSRLAPCIAVGEAEPATSAPGFVVRGTNQHFGGDIEGRISTESMGACLAMRRVTARELKAYTINYDTITECEP